MKVTERLLIVLVLLNIVLSPSIIAGASRGNALSLRSAGKGIGNGFVTDYYQTKPQTGLQHTLVILVDFIDVRYSQNKSAIDALIFGELAQYFADVSYGQIEIAGKSVGWYTLPNTMAYYGEDHSSDAGSDSHKLQLIKDTFDAIAEPVNLNDYSEIMIIHAGIGQEDSPRLSYLIWSDAYYEEISISTRQGAIIHSVAIAPEMESGNHSALGVYAHEYGHLLSLPDLYDSSLESGVPDDFVGRWSLMGTGLWLGNPNGTSPAELEAWSRIKLAWLVPDTLELAPGNPSFYHESLHPLETSNGIRAIKIPFSQNEYYLIEFRRRINFDRYLPSEGVLITRVDETKNTGVVQVMSANGSSPTLNHAAYGVGGVFNDTEHGIVIDIMARNSITYSILVGNQSPSPSDLTMTSITGPETINATQSQPAIFSAKLTDSSGIPLGALIVRVQCYENDTWNDVGLAVTNGGGIANFNKSLTLKPGKYEMRYLFTGSRIGSRYYVGSDQLAVLNIRKTGTNLTHELFYGAVALIMVASLATGYLIFQIRRRPKNSN